MLKIAIISQSARVYAQVVKLAGHLPMIVDAFADQDTRHVAAAYLQLPALLQGWQPKDMDMLMQTLQTWAPEYVIMGSGFESNMDLSRQLYQRFPVIGSTPECLNWVKQPLWLSHWCKARAIAFPVTQLEPPSEGRWLCKQLGGCGGAHVRVWQEKESVSPGMYYQQWQAGTSIGILCVVSTEQYVVIGVHTQQQRTNSFTFAGASRCHDPQLEAAATAMLQRLLPIKGLQGIISIDALWVGQQLYLLEINPRWSASMRLYMDQPLLQMHLEACEEKRITCSTSPGFRYARFCIAYAKAPLDVAGLDFPAWVEDRPEIAMIAQDDPLCSFYAQGETLHEVDQALCDQQKKLEDLWGTYVCSNIEFNIH